MASRPYARFWVLRRTDLWFNNMYFLITVLGVWMPQFSYPSYIESSAWPRNPSRRHARHAPVPLPGCLLQCLIGLDWYSGNHSRDFEGCPAHHTLGIIQAMVRTRRTTVRKTLFSQKNVSLQSSCPWTLGNVRVSRQKNVLPNSFSLNIIVFNGECKGF